MVVTNLNIPKLNKITEIIQISDIHIRNGDYKISRYDEFTLVFQNLFNFLNNLSSVKNQSAICIITGDIFHNKSKLESPGIKLFNTFINGLNHILPTLLILGNHDFKQNELENNIDFLEAFEKNIDTNVKYLKDTGLYKIKNLGIGLFSVKDSLQIGSGFGKNENLQEFPKPDFDDEVTTTIQLFHGTMCNSKFSNKITTSEGYSWEWLDKGYDCALLGDVHKRQIFPRKSNLIAAYSGSILQQNFGESLLGHGGLLWNIENNSNIYVKEFDIFNHYGFVKLIIENKIWYCENQKLEDLLLKEFPNNLQIRIFGNPSVNELNNLHNLLNGKTYVIDNCYVNTKSTKSNNTTYNNLNHENLINLYMKEISLSKDSLSKEYSVPSLEEVLINPKNEWSNKLISSTQKKKLEIEKQYNIYKNAIETISNSKTFKLKYLEWENLLCYSGKNWFDFDLTNKNVNLISADNGGGKSSFLDIICFSLFGKCFPSGSSRGNSIELISKYKTSNKDSYTSIRIIYDNKQYKITRILDKNGKLKSTKGGIFLLENDKWKTICLGNPQIKEWISKHLGTINEFMIKNIISQQNDGDFLLMKSTDQKLYLEQIFGLKINNAKVNLFKEIHSLVKKFRNDISLFFDGCKSLLKFEYNKDELDAKKAIYNTLEDQLKCLESKLIINWNKCNINDLKLTKSEILKKVELLSNNNKYDVNYEETIINDLTNIRLKQKYLENNSKEILKNIDTNIEYDENYELENIEKPNDSKNECIKILNKYNLWNEKPKIENRKEEYDLDLKLNTIKLNALLEEKQTLVYEGEIPKINYEDCIKELEDLKKTEFDTSHLLCENTILKEISLLEKNKEIEYDKINSLSTNLFVPKISIEKIEYLLAYITTNEKKYDKLLAKQAIYNVQQKVWQVHSEKVDINTQKIEKNQLDLSNISATLKNVPFNPKCEACCKQPLRIQYKNLVNLQNELENESQTYIEHEKKIVCPNFEIIQKTNEWIIAYNEKKLLFNKYLELKKKWNIYNSNTTKINKKKLNVNNICKELQNKRNNLLNLIKIRKNKNRLYELNHQVEQYEKSFKYYENIKKIECKINNIQNIISDIKDKLNKLDCQNAIEASLNALYIIAKSNLKKWNKYEYNYFHKYTKEFNSLNILEKNSCDKLSNIENDKAKQIEFKYWLQISEYKNKFDKNLENIEKINKLRENLKSIHSDLQIYEYEYNKEIDQNTKLETYNQNIKDIDEKVSKLKNLEEFYNNYSIWLYKKHILPQLVENTNKFISNIEPTITLQFNIDNDGNFLFYAKNNNVNIVLEKLSGFEYFIIAICLRLSFVTLTSSNIESQFIIDEGFTSCDKNHLQKIPNFLESLLSMFDSIILVSHLEFINESINNRFYIKNKKMNIGKEK